MTDSQDLLAEYRRNGSDAAFRELATRFVDLVHSTALRLVEGDTHRAEDVTQTVFVDLARLARTLSPEVRLGGWLHRHTCFVAANTLRGERRRQARERQAVEMNTLQNHSEADFSQVAPLLDEAINELDEADRTAILLRFFEQQDFRAVGQALGSNEDAARMRVTRALEKLEEFLKRRGVTTSAASLGVVLTAHAVQAAPVGLVVTITTAAALAGTTIATTATATAIKTIAMTTLQKILIAATLVAAVGTGIFEARQASTLRNQVQTLQQQRAEQIQQLQRERDDMASKLTALRDDNERLNRNPAELLRLRGEVARLRGDSKELAQLKAADLENAKDPEKLAIRDWLARAADLAQRIEKMPETKIPEFRFLRPVDWLEIAKDASLETDTDVRNAAQMLGGLAKNAFARLMRDALNKFLEVHNGELPTEITQLKSFFPVPVEDEVLQRYELLHSGNLEDVPGLDKSYRLVAEKSFAPVGSGRPLVQIGTNGFNRTGQ